MAPVLLHRYTVGEKLDQGVEIELPNLLHIFHEYLANFSPPSETSEDALINATFYASRNKRDFIMVDIVDSNHIHITSDRLIYPHCFSRLYSPGKLLFSASPVQVPNVLTNYVQMTRDQFESRYVPYLVSDIRGTPSDLANHDS